MNRIIISILSILMIQACIIKPEPEKPYLSYTIENASIVDVEITIFNAGISGQTQPEDITIDMPSITGRSYYYLRSDNYLLLEPADSAYILFDDKKMITYIKHDDQVRNILDTAYWESEYRPGDGYVYRYAITNDDYENATEIK
jgi:hypothetical protein